MSKVIENLFTRRSCRSFQDKPIAREDLQEIVTCAAYAPSARNRQSWQFTIVDNQDKIAELAGAVGAALGNAAYNFYLPAAIVLVSNDVDNKNGLADCACAAQNIFLSAHAKGIASCWINQLKDVNEDKYVRRILSSYGVPKNHIVWVTAVLGYANGPIEESEKNLDVICFA